MNFKLLLWLLLLVTASSAFGQTQTEESIEQILEELSQRLQLDEADLSSLHELLLQRSKQPIDLNKATLEELSAFTFLSPEQAAQIIEHREQNGRFLDLLELQSVQALSLEQIKLLLPFIEVKAVGLLEDLSLSNTFQKLNQELFVRWGRVIESQKGFMEHQYLGTPDKLLFRYRANYPDRLKVGITAEKDPGEDWLYKARPDFLSGYMSFQSKGKIKELILGDFSLQAGQGLALWTGLSFGKGASIAGIARSEDHLKPYTSVNEQQYFRGIASEFQHKQFRCIPFVSYRKTDASQDSDSISSILISGFHRTANERAQKSNITQINTGLISDYRWKHLKLGSTIVYTRSSAPFSEKKPLYDRFQSPQKNTAVASLYYTFSYRNLYLFGELAGTDHQGVSGIQGALVTLSPKLTFSTAYRNYGRSYTSAYAAGFGESSKTSNEQGLYTELQLKPNGHWEITAFIDQFRFPWLKFGVDAPSKGYEAFTQISFTPTKRLKVIARQGLTSKEQNASGFTPLTAIHSNNKTQSRLELWYKINDSWQIRDRIELVQTAGEQGYLLYQDVIYHPLQSKLSGNLRFSLFDTGSYDSRIYTYENDVLYSYSIPAFQNEGIRAYLNLRYSINRNLDLWMRYSRTRYENLSAIGSGNELIRGNHKSDVKLQIRYQF